MELELHEDPYTFLIIPSSSLFRMRNVPDESCRENQNAYFTLNNFFPPENHALYTIMWRNIVEACRPQMTTWRMRIDCWIPRLQIHTQNR